MRPAHPGGYGRRNARLTPDRRIVFRVGINAGEIVIQQDRVGGNAVNIAARLEGIAEPGGIALSDTVYQQVHRVVSAGYTLIGDRRLKNIRDPVTVHIIPPTECSAWAGCRRYRARLPRPTRPVSRKITGRRSPYCLSVCRIRTSQAPISLKEWWTTSSVRSMG